MAKCAARTGADLMEEFEVGPASVALDREAGLWTVKSTEVFIYFLSRSSQPFAAGWNSIGDRGKLFGGG